MIQSPYRRGAEDGLIFGIYLTVLFYATVLSQQFPLLGFPALIMIAGVPVVIFMMMKRYAVRLGAASSFSMLWMQGLVIFACGSTIACAMLYIYLRWINPDFFSSQFEYLATLKIDESTEFLSQSKEMARQILDAGMIPRAIDMVIEFILLGVVSGSLLSMVLSAIIAITGGNKKSSY